MKAYYRKPDGSLGIYSTTIKDHVQFISDVKEHAKLPTDTTVLVLIHSKDSL